MVSHDRDFLKGLTNKVWEFGGGQVKEHIGDIYEFLKNKNVEDLRALEQVNAKKAAQKSSASSNKNTYLSKKELEKSIRKLQKQVGNCERVIDSSEKEIKQIETQLQDPEIFKDQEKSGVLFKQYDEVKATLKEKMEAWELLNEELENAQQDLTEVAA